MQLHLRAPQAVQGELFPATDTQNVTRGYRGTVASKVAGITYRQLDYWARKQIVEPLQNVTTAIGFLTQRTIEQLEGITIMCDGQEVHECTTSEQMIELLQSGKAIFGVSVGSLWRQIKNALDHEEYVDLTKLQTSTDGKRPIDDIAAMRMRKKLEAQRKDRAASGR